MGWWCGRRRKGRQAQGAAGAKVTVEQRERIWAAGALWCRGDGEKLQADGVCFVFFARGVGEHPRAGLALCRHSRQGEGALPPSASTLAPPACSGTQHRQCPLRAPCTPAPAQARFLAESSRQTPRHAPEPSSLIDMNAQHVLHVTRWISVPPGPRARQGPRLAAWAPGEGRATILQGCRWRAGQRPHVWPKQPERSQHPPVTGGGAQGGKGGEAG